MMMDQAAIDRFWAKVDRGEPEKCWEWKAGKDRWGYGKFQLARKSRGAHRIAFNLAHGAVPLGLCVLHRCDHPACCNPDHLFLGTHDDNMRDMVAKGRQRSGGGWINKPTCIRGHPFDAANTRLKYRKRRNGRPERVCIACYKAEKASREARNKALSA